MATDLGDCLSATLAYEGGFVDNPRDPGGATIFGITLATLRNIHRNVRLGVAQLRALTKAQAASIYLTTYYLPVRADELPPGVDLMVGDFAVNAGVYEASVQLQRALRMNAVDGCVGPATVAAAKAVDPQVLIGLLSQAQEAFYRGLRLFSVFGRGWLSRVDSRTTDALNMTGA